MNFRAWPPSLSNLVRYNLHFFKQWTLTLRAVYANDPVRGMCATLFSIDSAMRDRGLVRLAVAADADLSTWEDSHGVGGVAWLLLTKGPVPSSSDRLHLNPGWEWLGVVATARYRHRAGA